MGPIVTRNWRGVSDTARQFAERWRRGAETGERPRMTDKLVAGTRLHAPRRPVYLHACRKQAMSIRCHTEQYTGFRRICPVGAANPPRNAVRVLRF